MEDIIKKVIIYYRVSTEEQAQLFRLCQKKGLGGYQNFS
jgi:DNA invertase Pin-like site-specific DNA recombinase